VNAAVAETSAAVSPALASPALAANDALARGNLQLADYLCRDALRADPQDALAMSLLGHMASGLRRWQLAEAWFTRALALRPGSAEIGAWRDRARELAQAARALAASGGPKPLARPKYLLIKAWGYGFWSDMDHVVGQLLLAELTGRTPVVHWGANTLFGASGVANAFELYFRPVSGATQDGLAAWGQSFFPAKWTAATLRDENVNKFQGAGSRTSALHLLARDEDVVVSDFHGKVVDLMSWIEPDSPWHGLDYRAVYRRLFAKYIQLQPALQARVDAFASERMAGRRWVAVHVRGSDKITELRDLELVNQQYQHRIEKMLQDDPAMGIFLLTDSEHFAREYRHKYGERVLFADVARSANDTGVHYAGHEGRKLGEEVVLDAHLAARCDAFLGNGASNVSTAIRHLKDWAPGTFELIGADFLASPNLMLHRW
jgi:protein O-GlcNAc transferase